MVKIKNIIVSRFADVFIFRPTYESSIKPRLFWKKPKVANNLIEVAGKKLYNTYFWRFRDKILDKYRHTEVIFHICIECIPEEVWIIELTPKARKISSISLNHLINDIAEEIIDKWNIEVDKLNFEEKIISEVSYND